MMKKHIKDISKNHVLNVAVKYGMTSLVILTEEILMERVGSLASRVTLRYTYTATLKTATGHIHGDITKTILDLLMRSHDDRHGSLGSGIIK